MRNLGIALLVLLAPGLVQAQPAYLVKDVNTTKARTLGARDLASIVAVGTSVFFVGDDGGTGAELWKIDTGTGAASLVKDICPGACPSFPYKLIAASGQLFFRADDGTHGSEIWKSDGTAAGTVLVTDLNPGFANSFGDWLGSLGNELFFSGGDRTHGFELWALHTGTLQTRLVADINPGPSHSSPQPIAAAGGRLLFQAYESDHYPGQLWISDGTTAGTHRVRSPGVLGPWFNSQNGYPAYSGIGLPDGSFLFGANDGSHGYELWRTDGTDAGTAMVADLNPQGDSLPRGYLSFNGKIYFGASSGAASGLWVTDGTAAGTTLIKDTGGAPDQLLLAGGKLYFSNSQLWKTDGTAAGTIPLNVTSVLAATPLGTSVAALTGDLFFGTFLKLVITDGTDAGTVEVKSLGSQAQGCLYQPPLSAAGGMVFFNDCDASVGQQLWRSDGTTAGTVLAQTPTLTPSFPFDESSYSGPNTFLRPLGSELVFRADDEAPAAEVWKTDGTAAGTRLQLSSSVDFWPWVRTRTRFSPAPLRVRSSLVYADPTGALSAFRSGAASPESLLPDGASGLVPLGDLALLNRLVGGSYGLWKTDDTAAGTVQVSPQTGSPLGTVGSQLFLLANGDELWKTDGTAPGTVLVKDLNLGNNTSASFWTPTRSLLFFIIRDQNALTETLWRSDGTGAGTLPLQSFPWPSTGFGGSNVSAMFSLGNRVVLGADDGSHGQELWVSDGTGAGTHLVKDVNPGLPSSVSYVYYSAVSRGRLFYLADDGAHGEELWVSDGTDAGTHLIKDVNPGAASSQGTYATLVAVRDRVFFLADDGVHGYELWGTDGLDAGTHLVKDILPGPAGALISQLTPLGNRLLLSASDGTHGGEPWLSDGTSDGTFMVQDIAPGAKSSGPLGFTSASSLVYFLADDGTTGSELWAIPRSALGTTFADAPTSYWAWGSIEAVADAGITLGCGAGLYCPDRTLTRAEMGVFLGRGLHGGGFVPPPATGTRFTDVPASFWAADWLEQIATDGITQGCSASPPMYCPGAQVSRAEMAIFLLRARHGGSYAPPPATGTRFTDVPANYWAAAWIEQLAAEGITNGCGVNLYCPGRTVGRAEMAVFLARAFNLTLP